jgi:hypothetical protein
MNYKAIWDSGYAKRHAKIMATGASMNRRLCACQRLWKRMSHG